MKNRFLKNRVFASLVLVMSSPAAHSATLYWDLNGTTANTAVAVTGAWNGTNAFWNTASTGTGGAAQATNTTSDDLFFSSGTTYTAGTVTASNTRAASSINFEDNVAVTLAGPLGLGGAGAKSGIFVLTGNNAANTVSGAQTLAAASTIQTDGTGVLTISGGITGAQALTLRNNSTNANGITISTGSLNNGGTVTNSGTGSGGATISAVIGANVTGVVQTSSTSPLTLSGANTAFAGGITIRAGTVAGATSASAFGTGTITLGDSAGAASTSLNGATFTYANAISVASGNTGTATISTNSGSPTYTGAITLNTHDLRFFNTGFNIVASGGITGTGNIVLNANGIGNITLSGSSVNNTGTITNIGPGTGTATISAVIGTNVTGVTQNNSTSGLTLSGANTFTGTVNVNAGTLSVTNATGISTSSAVTIASGASLAFNSVSQTMASGKTLSIAGSGVSGTGALQTNGSASTIAWNGAITLAADATIRMNGTGTFTTASTGTIALGASTLTLNLDGSSNNSLGGVISGTGGIIKGSTASLALTAANTFSGGVTILGGTVVTSGSAAALGTGTVQLGDTSGALTATLNTGATALTFANPISVRAGSSGAKTLGHTGAAAVTYSGAVTLNTGLNLAASGGGALTMGAGGINLNANTLNLNISGTGRIFNDGVISGTGSIVMNGTSTGDWVPRGAHTYSGGTSLTSGFVAVDFDSAGPAGAPTSGPFGTGTLTLGGSQMRAGAGASRTVGNPITLSANTSFYTVTSEKSLTFSGPTTLTGATRTLTSAVGTTVAGQSVVFSGNIGEATSGLGIIKAGNGNITFTGTNTYTGNTDITAGNLSIGSTAALPGFDTAGRFSVSPGATLTVQNGVSESDLSTILGTGNFQTGSTLGIDTTLGSRSISLDLSAPISIVKTGANTLTLSGTNTYAGSLSVTGGSLQIATSSAVAGFPNGFTIASGASLVIPNAVTESEVTSILGTSNLAAGSTLAFDTTAGDRSFTAAITNSAAGSINLLKTGPNALTLTGANSYTGSTTVSNGILVAGGSTSSSTGLITVGNTTDNAVLNVPTGGIITGTTTLTVGSVANSSGAINLTGGTVSVTGDSDSGAIGGTNSAYGAFTMSSGTFTQQRLMFGGNGSSSGTGGVGVGHITGGTINSNNWFILSRAGASTGILTFAGGTLNHANASNSIILGLAGSGRAELNVTGGLIDNLGRTVNMGGSGASFHWTGTGLLNLNGGTLLTNSVLYDADVAAASSNSYINFSGGTLKAAAASATILPAFTSSGSGINRVFINGAFGSFSGGANIDTNGFDNTISANLLAPSGDGVTSLTIDSQGSGYIGAPAVKILDDGLPSTATAYAVVGTDPSNPTTFGKLTSVVITNPGVIVGTPTVSLVGGGGTGAAVSVTTTGANTSGGLTKTGVGTLFLTGANTYTGATTVNSGTLTVSGTGTLSGTSGLSVANDARFNYEPSTPGTLTLGIAGNLTLASGSTLGINFESPIAAPGSATVSGVVNLSLSGSYTSGNTYTVLSAAGGGLTGGTFNILNPVDFTYSKVVTPTAVEITPTTASPLSSAFWRGGLGGSPKVWAASDGSANSNWTSDGLGTATPLVPGTSATISFSDASALASDQVGMSLGANMAISGLISSSANPISLLKPDAATLTIGGNGIVIDPGAGSVTLNPDIILSSPQSWNNDSSNALTLNGTVINGTNQLTFNGSGTTTLANLLGGSGGLNVAAGSTTVTSATLTANQTWTNNSGNLLSIGNVINAGFTLTLGGANDAAFTGSYSGAGGLARTGGGSLTLAGGHSYKGVTTVGTGSTSSSTTGTIVMSGDNSALTGNVNVGNGSTLRLESATALGTQGVTGSLLGLFNGSTLQLRADSSTTFSGTNAISALNTAAVNIDVNPLTTASGNVLTISPGTTPIGNTVAFNITGGNSYSLAIGTIQNVTGTATNFTLNPTTANVSLVGYNNLNNGANNSTLILSGTSSNNNVTGVIANQAAGSTGTGNVAVTKNGASTWTLSGANTNTGTNTVTEGTLNLSGARTAAAGAFAVGTIGTATLNISNGSFSTGQFVVGNGSSNTSVGIVNQTGGSLTMGGNQLLIGNGGSNSLAGSTSFGTYNLSGGTLNTIAGTLGVVLGVNSGTTATFNLSGTGVLSMPTTSTLQITRSDASANCQNNTGSFIQTGGTATVGILQMGGSNTTPANNAGQNATLSITAGTFFANTFTQLSGGTGSTSSITIGGTASVTLPAFPSARGVGSTTTLTFDGGTLLPTAASAAYIPAAVGTVGQITNNGALIDVPTGRNITVGLALQNAPSSTGTLTKAGVGVLSLSGANTYTGATTINAGTLQLGSATTTGSLDLTSPIVNNATFAVNRTNAVAQGTDFSASPITGSGGFTQAGTGTTTLNAANTFTGVTTITAGTLATATIGDIGVAGPLGTGDATSNATNSASLVLNGGTLGYTAASGTSNRGFTVAANSNFSFPAGNNNAFTFTGPIVGAAGLTLSGVSAVGLQNTLTLAGDNSGFTGNLAANIGGIRVTNNNSLGSGTKTITATNGTAGNPNIQLDGTGGDITLPATFTYSFSNQTNNGALINLAGNNTVPGQINIASGGGGLMATSSAGNLTISANITAVTTLRDVFLGGASTGNVSGIISNGGTAALRVQKFGAGTWTLSGANTFSGAVAAGEGILSASSLNSVSGGSPSSNLGAPTTAANGTINLGGGNVLTAAPAATGALRYTGTGETTDRILNLAGTTGGGGVEQSGTGLLKFTSAITATGAGTKTFTLSGSTAGTGEIAGAIVDNLTGTNTTALQKIGTGTWLLSAANTYSGGTTVNGGVLSLGNGAALGTGSATVTGGALDLGGQTIANVVSVGTGGTLSGSGTLTGAATLAGSVTPGGSGTGLITLTSASVASTSSIGLQLAGTGTRGVNYDALTVSGVLALDGTVTVSLNGLTPANGQSFDLIDSTGSIDVTSFNVATDLILPALSGGLTWDTSAFATTGVVSIVSGDPFGAWAAGYGLTGGDALKSADPDNDGVINLLEFATNSSPVSGGSGPRVYARLHNLSGDDVLTYTIATRKTASFAANGSTQEATKDLVKYTVEASDALGTWNSVVVTEVTGVDATAVQAAITPALPALDTDWEWHTFRTDDGTSTDTSDFIRLKVAEAP